MNAANLEYDEIIRRMALLSARADAMLRAEALPFTALVGFWSGIGMANRFILRGTANGFTKLAPYAAKMAYHSLRLANAHLATLKETPGYEESLTVTQDKLDQVTELLVEMHPQGEST